VVAAKNSTNRPVDAGRIAGVQLKFIDADQKGAGRAVLRVVREVGALARAGAGDQPAMRAASAQTGNMTIATAKVAAIREKMR
jgi:hypothetical protein